jgi:tetratricopeptide (TPR) repeat protein
LSLLTAVPPRASLTMGPSPDALVPPAYADEERQDPNTGTAAPAAPSDAQLPAPAASSGVETPAPAASSRPPVAPDDTRAAQRSPDTLFQKATTALQRGEYSAAIDLYEALADTGFAHPDASYNRGLAYVMRVRARADRPGDLGRAAAAFEEALRMRPGDTEAEHALDLVRAEVTRRRARRAKDAVDVRPTLDRMLVGLASEETWGIAAITASLLLALGLILRRRPAGPIHVAGSVLAPTAAIALLALIPLTWKARDLRLYARPGVIVAPEVYLADETGRALGGDPIPEAASVETSERQGGMIHVRWGATEGWIPASGVRLLQP